MSSQNDDAGTEIESMQVKIQVNEKLSRNEDEQADGGNLVSAASSTPEFNDPAILAVRENPKFRYSKDELLKLREVPLSMKTPNFINPDEMPSFIWDPERGTERERKKSTTPVENGVRNEQPDGRRRAQDPRERIRKENDGIVLSPQRRSFNSGCFVPVREPPARNNRAHSPLGGKNENCHLPVREIQGGTRRIGSGRILRDSWDYGGEKQDGDQVEFNNFRGGAGSGRGGDDRKPYGGGRDFDMGGRDKDRRHNSRFGDRRRVSSGEKDEEPEWFSGGPISQNDTIELRGFDESEKLPGKRKSSQAKRVREWAKKKSESSISEESMKDEPSVGSARPDSAASGKQQQHEAKEKKAEDAPPSKAPPQAGGQGDVAKKDKQQRGGGGIDAGDNDKENKNVDNIVGGGGGGFNFDDIFKCDTIPELLANGVGGDGDNNTKSRFSRWFKRETPVENEAAAVAAGRRTSLSEDHLLKNLLNDINEPSVAIPGDSEAYFAPISPAANTQSHSAVGGGSGGGNHAAHAPPSQKPLNLVEMLQRSKQQPHAQQPQQFAKNPPPTKMMSLDELESRMRKSTDLGGVSGMPQQQSKPHSSKHEDEMSAFKQLLAQVSGGHVFPANSNQKGLPMSLMEMLSLSQQQDEARMSSHRQHQVLSPNAASTTSSGASGIAQGSSSGAGASHMSAGGEFSFKVSSSAQQPLHVQQQQQQHQRQQQFDILNKLINMHQLRASPLQDVMTPQQSLELLSRPEAQAILQGLQSGKITPQHLYQQLANPALQPRHREMLCTILKMQTGAGGGVMGPSPRVLSPAPPPSNAAAAHHMYPAQQQQLRVSPLQPNGNKDFKSVMDANKMSQGRAVTGMRVPQMANQWPTHYGMKQPGRAIVKASNFQNAGVEQFFNGQSSLQQRIFNQQQQQQQQQISQQQIQHRKLPNQVPSQTQQMSLGPQQSSGAGIMGPSHGNSTQFPSTNQQQQQKFQQLRAQHQQQVARPVQPSSTVAPPAQQQQLPSAAQNFVQPPNQEQPRPAHQPQNVAWQQFLDAAAQQNNRSQHGRGGLVDGDLSPSTTNQLARWFSPDLLERARGGELPSTAGLGQHAILSLEEVERQTAPPVHN